MSGFKSICSARNSAGSSIAKNESLSVAAGCRATILQPPSIIAGLPSAVAWSHPTAEGVPTSRPARKLMERCRRTTTKNTDAATLYENILTIQNAADLEWPATEPANAGVRGEFLLGIFPPDHDSNHTPPAPPAAPAK